jgi:anion-transporting  ArsA/GET3 family ATPase
VFGGFRDRADQTYGLLQAPGTAFVVVAAPDRDALREASYFVERLQEDAMPLAGLVLNRVHGSAATRLSAERAAVAADALEAAGREHRLTADLLRLHADRMRVIARETRMVESFTAAHPDVLVATAAAKAGDVHDVEGLRSVGDALAHSG